MNLSNLFLSTLLTVCRFSLNLFINKLFILTYGSVGLIKWADFNNWLNILSFTGGGLLTSGIIRNFANADYSKPKLTNTYFICTLALLSITLLSIVFLRLNLLVKNDLFAITIFSNVMILVLLAKLNGIKDYRTFFVLSFVTTLTPALFIGIYFLYTNKVSLKAYCIALILSWVVVLVGTFKLNAKELLNSTFSRKYLKTLILPYGFQGIVTFVVPIYFQIFVRNELLIMGELKTAIWQFSWSLNLAILSLLTAGFTTILLPHFSSTNLQKSLNSTVLRYILLLTTGVIVIQLGNIFFGKIFLELVYSKELSSGHDYFTDVLQLMYIKVIAWVLGLILLAKGRLKTIMLIDVTFYSVLGGIAAFDVEHFYRNFINYMWLSQIIICVCYAFKTRVIYKNES